LGNETTGVRKQAGPEPSGDQDHNVKQKLATWLLRTLGWRIDGAPPELSQYVLIAAPHTSNWDLPLMLAYGAAFGIKIKWMAKHSLFWPPLGWILRPLGGMPIVRHEKRNVVDSMAEVFTSNKRLVLVVPTEGTRERAEYWKSGFYHIAAKAEVPIVPSYLDFGQKRGGFGPPLFPTGEIGADMQYFREFYRDKAGKFPDQFGPVRLKEEPQQKNLQSCHPANHRTA
jgi:1-acyl-sn-glycerol-3-phosphate acyltransferase